MSLCHAITTLPLSLAESICEESTTRIAPSVIKGIIDLPRTRKQVVADGFGHQALGAAIMLSTGRPGSIAELSPRSPCEAATTSRKGIATSCGATGILQPQPHD